jgi:transcriptional regulator with XRE-family HTH domain
MALVLRKLRKQLGLTQVTAASRLGVSQPYLALLEKGERPLTPKLAEKAVRVLRLPATILPMSDKRLQEPASDEQLARELGTLGYPGFAYLRKGPKRNPAELLVRALSKDDLEARLAEALPWLLVQYPDMDHAWLARESRLRNLTNRLGFVVSLALESVKEDDQVPNDTKRVLTALLNDLRKSRLMEEQTFGQSSMTEAEKDWLRQNRPEEARYWNLLTDWKPEFLQYVRPTTK